MPPRATVISCTRGECSSCKSRQGKKCIRIAETDRAGQIIIVEPDRKLLYIPASTGDDEVMAPWTGGKWEAVSVAAHTRNPVEWARGIVDAYRVEPYLVVVRQENDATTPTYSAIPRLRSHLEHTLLQQAKSHVVQSTAELVSRRVRLSARITEVRGQVIRYLESVIPQLQPETKEKIAQFVAYESTPLGPFMPLFLDEHIEEVYVDRPDVPVYLDHQRFGRCVAGFSVARGLIPKLVTLLRAESNLHLDRRNPSLKCDLHLAGVPLRFAVSTAPLATDGFQMQIRRARARQFSLLDLVSNGTMIPETAALLAMAIVLRLNVTITGAPGTGKTTLLNALDAVVPQAWRKVYIEDAVESRLRDGEHQARFRVSPVDEATGGFSKSDEIVKTLHRSPDYLILGEVQTAEHSRALFQAVTAGLKTLQTCHSGSASALITRWATSHHVELSAIAHMDIIVTLGRLGPTTPRRVQEVTEIRRRQVAGQIEFAGLNTLCAVGQEPLKSIPWADDGAMATATWEQWDMSPEEIYSEALGTILRGMRGHRGELNAQQILSRLHSMPREP